MDKMCASSKKVGKWLPPTCVNPRREKAHHFLSYCKPCKKIAVFNQKEFLQEENSTRQSHFFQVCFCLHSLSPGTQSMEPTKRTSADQIQLLKYPLSLYFPLVAIVLL